MSVGCSKAIGIQNTRLLCKSCHPTWHTFAIQQDKAFNQFMLQKDRDEEDKTNDRELVHGFAGAPHIDANDIASFNTGIAGPGDYMLNTKGLLKASMSNANTFVLASGDLLMQGRHVTFVSSISATVVSGAQGVKRNDPAVCPYSRASNGVETAELKILQEAAMQGTPADLRISQKGHMIEGATVSDMPLYCIPISGITPGAPIPLCNRIPSMWDSVTRTGWTQAAPGGWWQWGKTDDPHLYVAKWGSHLVELRSVIGRTGGRKSGWMVVTIPAGQLSSVRTGLDDLEQTERQSPLRRPGRDSESDERHPHRGRLRRPIDPCNMAHLNRPALPSQYDQIGNVNEGTLVDGLVHPDGQPLHSRHIVASDRRCCRGVCPIRQHDCHEVAGLVERPADNRLELRIVEQP
ncbi:hypothetical protein [Bifidobacterium choladohabitans]|uniref:hypothetical protein n=1 Tax=Bifidobacterium choladohabitans TaxID=2750947 RepID=UPI001E303DFE|nr:hypothetical protein [Bifidobacterium choladohabitans]